MRIDLVCRNAQGIQTVADKRQVVHPVAELPVRPHALRKGGPEKVVRHAAVGRGEERERVHERTAAWHAGIAARNRQRLAELPADVPLMSSIASRMIRQSLDAFVRGDADLAQNVLVMDNEVDRMKREIEQSMLSKMHDSPQFTRQALDVLLIARNLERIGDHATNIAEDVIFWVRGADVRHGQVNVTG